MKIRTRLILEYSHYFSSEPPEDRLELIRHIPQKNLLFEIAGLNYRLKPYDVLKYDFSLETQREELRYFCPIDDNLYKTYSKIFNDHIIGEDYPLIFNRAANLFALEEILNSTGFHYDDEDFIMHRMEVWDGIFKYLLAINTEIVKIKKAGPEETSLESISASTIVLNELMIEDNPVYVIYRGIKLIDYLVKDPNYSELIKTYFYDYLNLEKDKYIYNIVGLLISNKKDNKNLEFIYSLAEPNAFFNCLSDRKIIISNPIKLLSIKKAPLFKDTDLRYIVLDLNFLANKIYGLLLNDFWFDFLKPQINEKGNEKYSIKDLKGAFGRFFEEYTSIILQESFKHLKYPAPLLFDDLKVNTSQGQIEVADLYIRQNKKILVGQVKSNSIYDNEKYSGNINSLYRNNREKFFEDFGVNQIFKSIKSILKYYYIFDPKLPISKKIEFFPIIVVNEKIFQTPLVSNLFYNRFHELLGNYDFGPHKINPLIILHVSDLEYLENSLKKKKISIWDLLKIHYSKIQSNLMPPFFLTTDRFKSKELSPRLQETIKNLIKING